MASSDSACFLDHSSRLVVRRFSFLSSFQTCESQEPALPECPEWSRSERLTGEKEMLGFYVTGHPLDDHERALGFFSEFRLGSVPEGRRGQSVRVAGILSGLATQKTRRGGLMARGRLEDASGSIPVVFFPSAYDELASVLRTSDPLLVRGVLQIENERAELHVNEVMRLEEAWQGCTRELYMRVGADLVTPERLRALRRVLDMAPGSVPVSLDLELPTGAGAVFSLRRHRVTVSEELVGRVDHVFGLPVSDCRS